MATTGKYKKDTLGTRIKENYENRTKQFLTRRVPTIIRLDGKAFHTYTKGLNKPFDQGLIEDMQETTKFLCENIQGCKLGYTQSDEITLVLIDYDNLQTEAWFDYNVQKITSISAAMATAKFNQLRRKRDLTRDDSGVMDSVEECIKNIENSPLAFFDSRVFQISEKQEVVNSLIWRQQDAERNSIQMLAQSLYSEKQLLGKNTSILQDMCFEKGFNWNDLHFSEKRGSIVLKNIYINGILVGENKNNIHYYPKDNKENYSSNSDRALQYILVKNTDVEMWCDIKIKKIRTKWEVVETPIFSKDRNIILNLI